MNNSLYSYELLKVARKSWQYAISDEVVYAIQYGDVIIGGSQGGYLNSYCEGNGWIEFFCYPTFVCPGRSYSWVAIMEGNGYLGRPLDNRHNNTLRRDNETVFSLIGDFPQDRQEVCFRSISSIVRLKIFDVGDGGWQNISKLLTDLILEPTPGFPWTITDGKLCIVAGGTSSSQMLNRQLPSDIVNTSPQAVSDVEGNLPPNIRDGRGPCISNFPFVLLGSHSEGGNFVAGNSSFQGIEVSFRPVTLKPTVVQYMRRWYTFHEQETSNTKDTKGTRNPHPNKGRVRAQPKKGSHAEPVNDPRLEEVEPQTSYDLHSDGCIAKNTRLGSLEDA